MLGRWRGSRNFAIDSRFMTYVGGVDVGVTFFQGKWFLWNWVSLFRTVSNVYLWGLWKLFLIEIVDWKVIEIFCLEKFSIRGLVRGKFYILRINFE